MATFTLEALKAEVERKYAPTIVENGDAVYELPNILQLDTKLRKQVFDLFDAIEDDETVDNTVDVFKEVLVLVTKGGKGEELVELLGETPAVYIELMNAYQAGTQLGEAELSSE